MVPVDEAWLNFRRLTYCQARYVGTCSSDRAEQRATQLSQHEPVMQFAMIGSTSCFRRPQMKKTLLAAAMLTAFTTGPVLAQMTADVKFKSGNYGTMVSGTVTGHEYFDYTLGAKRGQEMFVELKVNGTNGDGTAYFNILPPGSDGVAIFNGSTSADGIARIKLPEDGTYTIRVYLMGNDRDADKTVGYSVDISIQ
jgi:hypothetical protein